MTPQELQRRAPGFPSLVEHLTSGLVFCIVDNHPAQRAKAVAKFVDSTDGALRLYRLPAYPHSSTRMSGCG